MPHDLIGRDRLSKTREPGHLALVPVPDESERIGEVAVQETNAVDPERLMQRLVVTGEHLECARACRGDAVGHVVADAVGRIDQCVAEFGEEIRRQPVRGMVIVEIEVGLREAMASLERLRIENGGRVVSALLAHQIAHQRVPARADEPIVLLLDPPPPAEPVGLQLPMGA